MNDAGRIGFVPRGNYDSTATYDFLDVVYYEGNSYVAKKLTTNNTPDEENGEYWQILARADADIYVKKTGDTVTGDFTCFGIIKGESLCASDLSTYHEVEYWDDEILRTDTYDITIDKNINMKKYDATDKYDSYLTVSASNITINNDNDPGCSTIYNKDEIRSKNFTFAIRLYDYEDNSYKSSFVLERKKISPEKDGYVDLGESRNKWNNIYATNGIIQTSDRNKKNTIEELSAEKAQSFIYGLKPVTYKMNSGTSGRTHWGVISQDIEELLENLNLTSLDFAGLIKSPAHDVKYDGETGKIIKDKIIDGEYDYSLRYDEFIAPLIRTVQAQHEKIELLEQRVSALEAYK